ncbi:hypothetical protein KBC54_03065 [Patescibacteria group bacterium]|nr:hypothetical protein [Patescibacteria group bacterium]
MSAVEILLAGAIFALLVTGLAGTYLYGQESAMVGGSRIRAVLSAQEGIEVTRNIRDENYTNLVDGTYGIATSTSQWSFSGVSDLFGGNTRAVTISSPGTNRKLISSAVTWQQNIQRTGSVSLVTYLTNWRAIATAAVKNGLLIYGDGTATPKSREYDATTNTFDPQASVLLATTSTTFIVRTSPSSTEAILGFVNQSGVLTVACYNGTTWTQEWTATVAGTNVSRRFDIAYETNSGDVMVLYGTDTVSANELAYRTKPGSAGCGSGNWAAITNISAARTNGKIDYVRMAWDRRASSNLITAMWADTQADVSALVWSGTTWSNEPTTVSETTLDLIAFAQDIENIDLEYESLSGDLMMVWGKVVGNGANGVRYRTCTGGTAACTWSGILTPATFLDDATSLDISANPNSDQIVFASVGKNQSDLQLGYWSGTAWTNTANADTSSNPPAAGMKQIATGWLVNGATSRSVITYGDQGSNALDWYTGALGVFTKQTDITMVPAGVNPYGYRNFEMNPLSKDQLMMVFSDSNFDLFAKRLVMSAAGAFTWTNSDSPSALSTTLTQNVTSPFTFAFWRR